MTSLFENDGKNIPCTVLEVGPCLVTQVRTKEVDGYKALWFSKIGEKFTPPSIVLWIPPSVEGLLY